MRKELDLFNYFTSFMYSINQSAKSISRGDLGCVLFRNRNTSHTKNAPDILRGVYKGAYQQFLEQKPGINIKRSGAVLFAEFADGSTVFEADYKVFIHYETEAATDCDMGTVGCLS